MPLSPAVRRSPARPASAGAFEIALGHFQQAVVTGHAGQRVGRQGTANEGALALLAADAAGQQHHHLAAPADTAGHGVTAGDAFAEDGQVRHHAEVALGTAHAGAEAADHLIENQQGAELVAELAQIGVEVLVRRAGAAFRAERLDHDRRGAAAQAVELQASTNRREVVGKAFLGVAGGAPRNAHRLAPASTGNAHAVDQLVAPAVVGAADLDHPFPAGVGAGQADGTHDRLGAGGQHAEHLHRRHIAAHQFGELDLVLVQQAGDRAAFTQHLHDLFLHHRVVAAQQGRAASLEEVDVAIAVDVFQVRANGAFHGQGEGVVEGQVVLHTAGNHVGGLLGEALGSLATLLEITEHLVHVLAANRADRLFDQRLEAGIDDVRVRPVGDAGGGDVGGGSVHAGSLLLRRSGRSGPAGAGGCAVVRPGPGGTRRWLPARAGVPRGRRLPGWRRGTRRRGCASGRR